DQPRSPWLPAVHAGAEMEASTLLPTLGVLVAPWLMQFGGRADDWGWSLTDGIDAFHFAVADETAFADLEQATDRWGDAMVLTDVSTARDLVTNLNEVATTFGMVR